MRGFCFLSCVIIISLFFDRILASSFQADDDHQQTNNTTHFALFVFGDSLYDPGNNNFLNISNVYKANFPPYGETFFGFPTGRASDGRLIPDFVSLHANLPLWKPFLEPGQHEFINGANFASAAATVLPENNPLTEIYEMGGRKFAFQNVGPCGCYPRAKQEKNLTINECYEEMLEFPKLHNNALVNATKKLEIQLPEFKYMIFDFYTALLDMTYNPFKYGIKEVDIACCGSGIYRGHDCGIGEYDLCSDPDEYLYFDGDHPTDHAYSELAGIMWTGGRDGFTMPISLKQLFELELEDCENKNFSVHNGVSADE